MLYSYNEILPSYTKNKILIHAAPWMTFENMLCGKKADIKGHIIVWFYLYETSRISTFIDTEKIDYVFQKLEGVGNGVWLLIDLEFSFGGGVIKLFWN